MRPQISITVILLAATVFWAFRFFPGPKKKKTDPFVFAYYTGDGGSGLHLAWSEDGLKWFPLKGGKPIVKPGVGEYLMRDPHLSRTPDGMFHLVWTPGLHRKDIGYAFSKNLMEWSAQRLIPVMEKDTLVLNAWSPELIYDEDSRRFMLYWASTLPGKFPDSDRQNDSLPGGYRYNNRIYRKFSSDLREWTPTELFFDPGVHCADPHIATDSGRVLLFYKDATQMGKNIQNNIRMSSSGSVTGGFSTNPALVSRRTWAEAPTAVRLDSQFVVYFHKYRNRKMGAVATKDFRKWKDISDSLSFPRGFQHGTVLRVPEKILEKLKD